MDHFKTWEFVEYRPLGHRPRKDQCQRGGPAQGGAADELVEDLDGLVQVRVLDVQPLAGDDGPEGVDDGDVHCAQQTDLLTCAKKRWYVKFQNFEV